MPEPNTILAAGSELIRRADEVPAANTEKALTTQAEIGMDISFAALLDNLSAETGFDVAKFSAAAHKEKDKLLSNAAFLPQTVRQKLQNRFDGLIAGVEMEKQQEIVIAGQSEQSRMALNTISALREVLTTPDSYFNDEAFDVSESLLQMSDSGLSLGQITPMHEEELRSAVMDWRNNKDLLVSAIDDYNDGDGGIAAATILERLEGTEAHSVFNMYLGLSLAGFDEQSNEYIMRSQNNVKSLSTALLLDKITEEDFYQSWDEMTSRGQIDSELSPKLYRPRVYVEWDYPMQSVYDSVGDVMGLISQGKLTEDSIYEAMDSGGIYMENKKNWSLYMKLAFAPELMADGVFRLYHDKLLEAFRNYEHLNYERQNDFLAAALTRFHSDQWETLTPSAKREVLHSDFTDAYKAGMESIEQANAMTKEIDAIDESQYINADALELLHDTLMRLDGGY